MTATAKKARTRTRAARLPGQAPGPGGHTGFAVAGCDCWLCATHRLAERREAEDRALAQRSEDEPMTGAVLTAPNATAEFVAALGGIHGLQR